MIIQLIHRLLGLENVIQVGDVTNSHLKNRNFAQFLIRWQRGQQFP